MIIAMLAINFHIYIGAAKMPAPKSPAKGVYEKQSGSGVWWVRLPTGERHKYRRLKIGSYEDAVKAYEAREPVATTLLAAMQRYLALRPRCDPSYECHARTFARAYPGATLVDFAQLDNLRAWQSKRLTEVSRATVNHEQAFLSGVFQQAELEGLLASNPIGKGRGRLPYLRVPQGRTRWLRPEEEALLATHLSQDRMEAVQFAVHTGLRRGEQWKLEWRDCGDDSVHVAIGKNGRSREVPLNNVARGVLEARRKRGLPRPFPASSPERLSRPFNDLCKRLGLEDLTWHSLRHTTGTRLARGRVQQRVIQAILGHSSVTMTERYTHLVDDQLREAVDLLAPSTPRRSTPRRRAARTT